MKRIVLVLALLLLLFGAGSFVSARALPAEAADAAVSEASETRWTALSSASEWEAYVKEELLPVVVLVLTTVAAVYIAISPILARIKRASERFKSATDDVHTATGTVRTNEEKIGRLEKRLTERIEHMERAIERDREENAANHKDLLETKKMLRLAFSNMDELVVKGCAHSIMELGHTESIEGDEKGRGAEGETKTDEEEKQTNAV